MRAYRGIILNPRSESYCSLYADGLLVVNDAGQVQAIGSTQSVAKRFGPKSLEIAESKAAPLILPGFTDVHLHWVQNRVKGSAKGQGLVRWLNDCVWPEEARFVDASYAQEAAAEFFAELARHGTMAGAVYSSIHESALEAFAPPFGHFVVGNVMMPENSPRSLAQSQEAALAITEKWAAKLDRKDSHIKNDTPHLNPLPQGERKQQRHSSFASRAGFSNESLSPWGRGQGEGCLLCGYAVSPRFAPTCSMELMRRAAAIAQRHGCVVQTHLSENLDEVAWVHKLFPGFPSYTAVYQRAGLLGARTILGHCIYLDDDELAMLKRADAVIAHCPTSNAALGSGRMPIERVREAGIRWALATDIAAGPSLSMLHVMKTFLEVHAAAGFRFTPASAFYRATLAGAESLGLADRCGNLDVGKEANFVLLDPPAVANPHDANEMLAALLAGTELDFARFTRRAYFRGQAIGPELAC